MGRTRRGLQRCTASHKYLKAAARQAKSEAKAAKARAEKAAAAKRVRDYKAAVKKHK